MPEREPVAGEHSVLERSATGSAGMCRAIQPGGTWNLPTLVTRAQPR